ncbi:MAG: adenylate/guanylate cyclase domain-containing protein [Myxococcota bacterium]
MARAGAVGRAALALSVGLFYAHPWLLDRAEYALLDWRFRMRGESAPNHPVVVVAVDAESLDELGRWPWPRSVLATLIERLDEAQVRAIGLDMIFSEQETAIDADVLREARRVLAEHGGDGAEATDGIRRIDDALAEADTDAALAAAIRKSGRVVLGYFFRTGVDEADGPERLADARRSIRRSQVSVARAPVESRAPILTCTGLETNLREFQQAARRSGFFTATLDPDGAVRRAPLVARCQDSFYVSLALAVYEVATGSRAALMGDADRLLEVRVGDKVFPTDEGGGVLIDYRGPAGTFPYVSAADVIRGRVGAEQLAGAIALVGPTEVGLYDSQATPFGASFPGVEVQANIVDGLLSGEVLQRYDWLVVAELGLILAIGLLLIVVVPRTGGATASACFALMLGFLVVTTSVLAFNEAGVWLNLAYPLATLVIVYLSVEVTRSLGVEAASRHVRRMFSTYVPPEVVEELTRKQDSFALGGEERELSILFSDLRGFTAISEDLGARDTTLLMNAYFSAMTRTIFESAGTLDKYIGDAIMAFWGAPLPVADHPHQACRAALAMQDGLGGLAGLHPEIVGIPRLRMGIGLHVAPVVVGNLGSELRFDYTIVGDGVNLCSRLESLSQVYGAAVVCSGDFAARLPSGFLVRELDTIRVKGRRQSCEIFEVVAERSVRPGESHWLQAHAAGLDAYRGGRWEAAESAFAEVLAARPDDTASLLLVDRIRGLRAAPPENWQGVWTFESK